MNELVEYLDSIGHALGLGGIEGLIGAPFVILAFLIILAKLLKGNARNNGYRGDLEWMKGESDKKFDLITNPAYKSLHCNIWHKKGK